jgi:uncharacterized membrane protein
MTLLNLFIAGLLAWFGYKFICMAIEAFKLAVRQANQLEEQFGPDILAALRYQLGLGRKDGSDG